MRVVRMEGYAMKIVCGACGAKYSIADEKVTGRSVKIRCKKCSESIVVRGEAAPVADAGAWHVIVDGDQRGPMAPAEIGTLIASGTIGWDAYVWREGLAEWKPAEDVKELVAAIMGEPAETTRAGADLFATESQSAFAAAPPEDDGVVASSLARTPRGDVMTGARNESSVLFSLANLSALGAGGSHASAQPSRSAAPRAMASGEGSGLIDIRALASATGLGAAAPASPRPTAKVDDLLGLGAPSLSLGSPLAAPILIAPTSEPSRSGRAIILAAAILAVGLLGGASAFAYASVQRDAPAPIALPAPIVALPIAPPTETHAPLVVATVETPIAVIETDAPVTTPTRPTTRRPPVTVPTRPVAPTTEATPPRSPRERDLTELIEAVTPPAHEAREEHRAPVADPSLPVTPARSDVMSAMTRVQGAVAACGGGEHGIASVQISIASSGRVSNAVVGGAFAGTPVGSCIARAVRTATVAPFSQSTFSLTYPFRI